MRDYWNTRFARAKKSFELDDFTEGYYQTSGRFLHQLYKDAKELEFNWKTRFSELDVTEQANIRKTITDVSTGQVSVDFAMNAIDGSGETILSTGIHCMQLIAKMDTNTVDENEKVVYIYSNSLIFDFYKGLTGSHVGIQMNLDSSEVITDPINSLLIKNQQYINTNILYYKYLKSQQYNLDVYTSNPIRELSFPL